MSELREFLKSNQEQAVAAWINHLNQVRLDELLASLSQDAQNLETALDGIDAALSRIDLEVVLRNRGGLKGMHGFIAEIAEVGVGNARSLVRGGETVYQWVNDNGPVDLLRSGVEIQQKFVASGGRFGLGAITEHLEKYPDFVRNGGKYQIPADHFEMIRALYSMPVDEASRLTRGGTGPSSKDWERVQAFFRKTDISVDNLEPSKLDYSEVQRGSYQVTLGEEKESLRSKSQSLRDDAYRDSRPSVRQGAGATFAAAGVEGGTAFILAIAEKRRQGLKLKDFASEDWFDIAGSSAAGAAKGGVRGFTIYGLTNFTATSAAVASSAVTAAFGIAEQAHKFRAGEISEVEFIENAELVCLETAVSALSSFVGQALIPVPVLGAVIGNTVGIIMYRAVASSLSEREAALVRHYLDDQQDLDARLSQEHEVLVDNLAASLTNYLAVIERSFSPDIGIALLGSIELALELGVLPEQVLDSPDKMQSYFLD